MKKYFLLIVLVCNCYLIQSQSLIGAWVDEVSVDSENLKGDFKTVSIFTEKYHVSSAFKSKTGVFIGTFGGSWSMAGDTISLYIEFDSKNPERVGTTKSVQIKVENDVLHLEGENSKLRRIDDGTPGALAGAWLMSGRKRNGEFQKRDTSRPRKTMKILSGTRFQWIAYNTETKEFMGTGGGTYSTIDGKYTENIEFFSKDDSRVGASLEFDYELKDGDWHHSGLSSKGQPIYEVWSLRK